MYSINERIMLLINELGYNKNSFSKAIGINQNVTISNIVGGRLSKPSFEILESIVKAFPQINTRWLLTGDGEILERDDLPQIEELLETIKKQDRMLDRYHSIVSSHEQIIEKLSKTNGLNDDDNEINKTG